ncbi:MAG: DUF2849 domain-containing protein [Emcibacter sp.]|nr:DUF2849 domain-containing protein [Emcibacter sp.]
MQNSLNVISANHLRSGLNVYFIQDENKGHWNPDISLATLYDENTVQASFEMAKQDLDKNIVVDCVIVQVDANHNPLTTREQIRAGGPSIQYGHNVN